MLACLGGSSSIKAYGRQMDRRAKSLTRADLKREARTALREVLKREPTAAEIRYLFLGQEALGDKGLLRVQAQNVASASRILRQTRQELLARLRKQRQQMKRLLAKARRFTKRTRKRSK
jgi:hypothetical protein